MLTRRQFLRLGAGMGVAQLAGCAATAPEPDEQSQRTLFCFNTVCVLGGSVPNAVLDEAERLCQRFEQLLSRTIPTSDVGRINAADGKPTEVDPQTAELIGRALGYCKESGGLFDITIGAVSELWDFAEGVVPMAEDIAAALPHVDWRNVRVEGSSVTLVDPLARIDLGGIAKGYVADRLCELFASHGVTSAYVNLGGNVKVLGPKATGDPWSVGVRDPFDEGDESVVAKVHTNGGSLVTSGLYERSFERDGRTYWHILDPRTGYPVETNIVSASIYSEASLDGDGYTKPLFMLERDDALAFLETRGLDGLLIDRQGGLHVTPASAFEL